TREDPDAFRRNGWRRARTDRRRRLRRDVDQVHRRARLRGRAHRCQAEPRDLLPGGARVQGQTGPPGGAARAHVRDRARRRSMRRIRRGHVLIALFTAALCVPAAGVGSGTATGSLPTKIGKGEGSLNLIEWPAYADKSFANKFVQQTGCKIHRKDAGSSNQMVALMRTGGGGGGGQWDLVSASGDASLRLIRGGDVKPVNINVIPSWNDIIPHFKSQAHNTLDGKHYGVSLQWGPNVLLYNTKVIKPGPTSWAALYDPKYKGKITIPNNP